MAWFRQTAEALIQPFFLCLILLGWALSGLCQQGDKPRYRVMFAMVFLCLLTISLGILPKGLTQALENQYPVVIRANPEIHWVVVLSGGQSRGNQWPSNQLIYGATLKRLTEGVRLFKQLPDAKLLLSGGGYGGDRPEASRLEDVAKLFGIQQDQIKKELSSINTPDQAREIKRILGSQRFYLVTSASHMPRAMALCVKQGLHPIPAPTDFTRYWDDERWQKTWIPNANNIVYLSIALHEMIGMVWEKLRGQL